MSKPLRPTGFEFFNTAARSVVLILGLGLGGTLLAQSTYSPPYSFTTLAGTAVTNGSSDGTGSAAQFRQPYAVAIDSSGNVYVADTANQTIRKVTAAGVVTTLAGKAGYIGSADGTGTAATFNNPQGIAVGSGGNVYVADSDNNTIRKIAPGGVVTTMAGTVGTAGDADGTGTAATFSSPIGLAVDSTGNVYVADSANNTIRKVTQGGVVTTVAGTAGTTGGADGTGSAAQFSNPRSVALDGNGNIYVADTANNTIRKIASGGVVTTVAGTAGATGSADGTGAAARFSSPRGVAADSNGNVFVADSQNSVIRMISSAGVVTTLGGVPGAFANADGMGSAALFDVPTGIAVDGSDNVFIADNRNNTIRKGSPSTAVVPAIAQQPANQTVSAGSSATFSVSATGSPTPTLQWYFDGVAVPSATGSSYTIAAVTVANAGSYTVIASNSAGTTTSAVATLTVTPLAGSPAFTAQPVSQTIASGATVVFRAPASSSPAPTYQWSWNGTPLADGPWNSSTLSGATGPTLVITAAAAGAAGAYTCTATNSLGAATSNAATLDVIATIDAGRLINVSSRALVGTGSNVLITGFVVGGKGTSGSEPVLIRASGPALVPFGIEGWLPDPQLQLDNSSGVIATNNSWGGNSEVSLTAAAVGAFPWTSATSKDSALVETLSSQAYSAVVSGASGDTGVALAEVYDATPPASYTLATPRLINVSVRTQAGSGDDVLIAGFVIGGSTAKTVLIRASGPALEGFGVAQTLPDPKLELYNGATLLAGNAGWGGDPQISSTAAAVGAFAWTNASSADSALLITLAPGAYSAIVSGQSGDTGVALVEVYDVP